MSDWLGKVNFQALGEELKRARIQCNLRQEDVAQIINISRTTLVAIEKGERKIRAEELVQLAQLYHKQLRDFLHPAPALNNLQGIQFRGPIAQTEEHKEQIEFSKIYLENLCRKYLELERISNITLKKRSYLNEYTRKGLDIELEAEVLAQEERNRLGLGDAPLPSVRTILEQDVGIKIFFFPLKPPNLSGIYCFVDELGPCIAINSSHQPSRQRWTMCHDYCHFLVDRYEPTVLFNEIYKRIPASEKFADNFAKYFLMPRDSVRRSFSELSGSASKSITLSGLYILANRFGVSLEAITRRLEDLKLLKSGAWERLKDGTNLKINELQKQLNLLPIQESQDTFPLAYRIMAIEAYKNEIISEGQLTHILEVERLTARQLVDEDIIVGA